MLWTSFAEVPGENFLLRQDMRMTISMFIYAKSKKKPFTLKLVLFSRSDTAPDVFSVLVAHVLV